MVGPMIVADLVILISTVIHTVVGFSLISPVDSPLKKPVLKLIRKAVDLFSLNSRALATLAMGVHLVTFATACKGDNWTDVAMQRRGVASLFCLLTAPVFMKLTYLLEQLGAEKAIEVEQLGMNKAILEWKPPSLSMMDTVLAPYYKFLSCESLYLARIPEYPCFYVMNHSLYGIEMAGFIHTLYKEKGVYVRGLADHFHFMSPHGTVLRDFGAVDGTRANVDLLMEAKRNLLVYPGGGQEIMKPKTVERYELMWKERLGFARMAIKHKYPIMPCACVGPEDMLDILFDLPVSFLKNYVGLTSFPVVAPNSIQKLYFWFGEPIPTEQYDGDADNTDFAKEVRDKTKAAIEAGIKEMQAKQAADPDRYLRDRVAKDIREAQAKATEHLKSLFGAIKVE